MKTMIKDRLRGKPWLKPIFSNVFCIPERLRRNDPNLFVVFNSLTDKYEIHSLENKGNSFSLQVPFEELDARIEEFVKKYDLRRHGRKIFYEIETKNKGLEQASKRERVNDIRNLADELHKPIRKLAYWGE